MSGTLSVPSLPTSLPGMIVLFYDQEKTDPPCVCRVLPVVLIMVPFGVIAKEYRIVHDANDCSCWYCLHSWFIAFTHRASPPSCPTQVFANLWECHTPTKLFSYSGKN